MLERLFTAIAGGPSLNCRPHNSRQRVDWATFESLKDRAPAPCLLDLLGTGAETRLVGRVKAPPMLKAGEETDPSPEAAARRATRREFAAQQQVLSKLRVIVDEARTYENDTGVYVLNVGFPLLSLPPAFSDSRGYTARRVLAPLAFIPVSVSVQTGAAPGVTIACKGDDIDRVMPNEALLAWLEQQTGKARAELFADEEGKEAWKEIGAIVKHVAAALDVPVPGVFQSDAPPQTLELLGAPKAEDSGESAEFVLSAVLGLFPAANQGLIRDTKEMLATGVPEGTIRRFVTAESVLGETPQPAPGESASQPAQHAGATCGPTFSSERHVAAADPCQARAAALALSKPGLVVHGPPGTGKSQTITNIISDHLARGQRVLFVCDKRTALDVVANRLAAQGLGDLCAVVHDPQRDQKDLYMSIRAQVEGLADANAPKGLGDAIDRTDAELTRIHAELSAFREGVNGAAPGKACLHDLVGRWIALAREAAGCGVEVPTLRGEDAEEVERRATDLTDVLSRAGEVKFAANPWRECAGCSLAAYLSRSGDDIRRVLDAALEAARASDAERKPGAPAFPPTGPLGPAAQSMAAFADELARVGDIGDAPVRAWWATKPREEVARARATVQGLEPTLRTAHEATPDPAIAAAMQGKPVNITQLAQSIGALERYVESAKGMLSFLAIGKKRSAGEVLAPLGLATTPENASRALGHLRGVHALAVVRATLDGFAGRGLSTAHPEREIVLAEAAANARALSIASRAHEDAAMRSAANVILRTLEAGVPDVAMVDGLKSAPSRAKAIESLENAAASAGLFSGPWLAKASASWRSGEPAAATFEQLRGELGSLESVLRVQEGTRGLGETVRAAVNAMLVGGVDASSGLAALRRGAAAGLISEKVGSVPGLLTMDAVRVRTLFARWRELESKKRALVRDAIVSRWTELNRTRLLAANGARLNSEGAMVKQRLVTRGSRAMRLRQVLMLGRNAPSGDPLLDLRPVWMASPETVAQIFPRHPIFDCVVFDEASQCRLEDALPVLTRGKRVVIAGDPKQLPPTRFFESAAAASEEEEIATDAQLFEAQQTRTEDLLGAALNLDFDQSYLDVHYRSRNAELIEFSNEHFYGSRLQAIPGHPGRRGTHPPLRLVRVAGVYEDRTNEPEAARVVELVRELLARPTPPSIGIACFNLAQRDLIVELLDIAAEKDGAFAKRLSEARGRMGSGAPEGLFVKNLENVQGDERDHIIISTTYGPTRDGKFFRRFGPLLQPGGGRRLNVLVTRAKQEIHLVTSIPRDAYLSLPQVPPGSSPGGGWLLMAYLKFAEDLESRYGRALPGNAGAKDAPGRVEIRPSGAPSGVAQAIAPLVAPGRDVVVHWGNDGFCVDLSMAKAGEGNEAMGVLCDFARRAPAGDTIAWDVFRTGMLEAQGWRFERVWSPGLFRDLGGVVARLGEVADGGRPA